jgi:hypothetical protein
MSSSGTQVLELKSPLGSLKQQKSSPPVVASVCGVLHERVGSSFSGLSPESQEKGSPPPEQSTEVSAMQPVGGLMPLLLLPVLPLLLPPLAVVEHPSSAPVLPPPTAAMATVNRNPLTVFQP